ncbi:shikimate dehydrogenase [Sedimentibacter acidaminivorans]|uniref:Shikimate dehydrogenase (NADP(+)) n=1 Tax=Sedimentibacter acidaminivorans TaxID=913099 RepID=A0ABS4GAI2_9FIRM|nr:shikimate dehydrogenase [Sedimentibacter acidaminivorans]MBP1924698.1 shikimate dehydrogenase [Sedimentibacter acidaminivorans]
MAITVDTKMIALLGKPLRQSFSPRMQNEAYEAAGLDYHYFPVEVENDHLGDVINGLKYMNFVGFAVTKPNKIEVMQYLDEIDELAEKMGSCNTIVNNNGKLKGYNTDGEGFVRSLLSETDCKLEDSVFFCFGAGGAGRAICSTLAFRGAKKIYIVDKFKESSKSLVEDINTKFAPVAELVSFENVEEINKKVSLSNVVINASGIGMYPHLDEVPVSKESLNSSQICFDATYNPLKTKFLVEAESIGCKILNGIGMVINQGVIQYSLWTGLPEPIETFTKSIEKIVSEK